MHGQTLRVVATRAFLALTSAALTLLALEVGLRGLVAPSATSAGRLLGSELPPVRLIPPQPPAPRMRQRPPGRLRRDDLAGQIREDPIIGYAPRERAVSTNAWWQSNNLGARARTDTATEVPPGRTRVLVFGDSFAAGSRVPQEAAWPAVLEAAHPELEVVSLGVDGYGAGQSLLRYRVIGGRVAHQVVVLTLSPRADFWRDVNTLRALAGWRSYTVMPRFVLEDGRLRLVPSPYDPPAAIYADNRAGPSPRLHDHLRRYDRFYVPWMYREPHGLVARSLLLRLALARWHTVLVRREHAAALDPDGEAVVVTARIAATMRHEAAARGARFLLVVIPGERDLGWLRRSAPARAQWRATVAALRSAAQPCLDLADELLAAPSDQLDRGADGTHHGPRANRIIAAALERAFARDAANGAR